MWSCQNNLFGWGNNISNIHACFRAGVFFLEKGWTWFVICNNRPYAKCCLSGSLMDLLKTSMCPSMEGWKGKIKHEVHFQRLVSRDNMALGAKDFPLRHNHILFIHGVQTFFWLSLFDMYIIDKVTNDCQAMKTI